MAFSRGRGVDGVIVTASTQSSDPMREAAQMCLKRGRIWRVGVTGLNLNRADFYEKELSFQVSCSYGPGRYDPEYEDKGRDYPIGFVRWTEGRNFEAVLDMISEQRLDTAPLISKCFPFEEVAQAYRTLTEDKSALGVLLKYESPLEERLTRKTMLLPNIALDTTRSVMGVIGAGNYATRMLIPALKQAGAQLHTIATTGGLSSAITGGRSEERRVGNECDRTGRYRGSRNH